MSTTTVAPDRSLALPRVMAALCGIALLALVLPYGAVRSLHERRLHSAETQLAAVALAISAALDGATPLIPHGTHVLAGPGPRPVFQDDLWTTAPAFPLSRLTSNARPDPWGNAYMAHVRDRRAAWVLSAGPDGIVQTPFVLTSSHPAGDDRFVRVR